jgi:hypothetical protein
MNGVMEPVPVVVTRKPDPLPLDEQAAVVFDTRNGSLELVLHCNDVISWQFTRASEGSFETGDDLRWAFGRIRGSGPTARRFWDIKEAMGLTLGQIEAELRAMSHYKEGTE